MNDLNQVKKEKALLGAGCFWGVEKAFAQTPGVLNTRVGFAGGTVENPTYKQVCQGDTGHAEVVYVEFDPEEVSYEGILDIFWNIHNPTEKNRQGPDIGSQYRSVIFYYTDEQANVAQASKEKQENLGKYANPIVTHIQPAPSFYEAEEYHQKYWQKEQST